MCFDSITEEYQTMSNNQQRDFGMDMFHKRKKKSESDENEQENPTPVPTVPPPQPTIAQLTIQPPPPPPPPPKKDVGLDMFQRRTIEFERNYSEPESPTPAPIVAPPQLTIVQLTIQPPPPPPKKDVGLNIFQRRKIESERADAEQENPTPAAVVTPPQQTIIQPTIQPTPAPRKKDVGMNKFQKRKMESGRAAAVQGNPTSEPIVTRPQPTIAQPTVQLIPAPGKKMLGWIRYKRGRWSPRELVSCKKILFLGRL